MIKIGIYDDEISTINKLEKMIKSANMKDSSFEIYRFYSG